MSVVDGALLARLSKYITARSLDEPPSPRAAIAISQRLNTLHHTLASFLPRYITENEALLDQDNGHLTAGTFLFADVAGFTALSEQVMQLAGTTGIEILTEIINTYFATMLEILAKSDGELLKFAGDALLAFFPAKAGQDDFLRAIHTSLRMQRAMRAQFQPISHDALEQVVGDQAIELVMSIGLAQGELFEALVGNLTKREHIILGHLAGLAMDAEEVGVRDDIIVPNIAQQYYAGQLQFRTIDSEFCEVLDTLGDTLDDYEFTLPQKRKAGSAFLFGFEDDTAIEGMVTELARVEQLARFISTDIVNKLVLQGNRIESENRPATVIFVHFTGFAELLAAWGEENLSIVTVVLSRYYSIMQRAIAQFSGTITRCDPYQLGSKILVTFGAPIAHIDDPMRAIATALEMNRQLDKFNSALKSELPPNLQNTTFIKQRMGITHGVVFAGEMGWRQRREYTVMGDHVNLAARLMSKADFGDILISQEVYEQAHRRFDTFPLAPFTAKGKQAKVQAHKVIAELPSSTQSISTSRTPFIGRQMILHQVWDMLERIYSGDQAKYTSAIAFEGKAGVGKTRLMQHLAQNAASKGIKVAWVTCHPQSSSKNSWGSVLKQLLDDPAPHDLSLNLIQLDLVDLEDALSDLIFDKPNASSPSETQLKVSSEVRKELFNRLSSESTQKINRDQLLRARRQAKRQLSRSGETRLNDVWEALNRSMSLTEALIGYLQAYTYDTPTLIVLDDLHHENSRAINTLNRISQALRDARLLILAAYDTTPNIDLVLQKVQLHDFTWAESNTLAANYLKVGELGQRLEGVIWQKTHGRPFYVEAFVETLKENNHLDFFEGRAELHPDANIDALSHTLRGMVVGLLDRFSGEKRQLLQAAAVIDNSFSEALLQAMGVGWSAEQIHEFVNEMLSERIFHPTSNERHEYHFRHGVIQQVIYEELNRIQRQKLHSKIASIYEETSASDDHAATQEIFTIVYHLLRAEAPTRALEVIDNAAKRAETGGNMAQALELYTKALEIFPDDRHIQEQIARLTQ